MNKGYIYHITTNEEWESAIKIGQYETTSLITEGFIHCCYLEQIQGVLYRYFKNKTNLVKLKIDVSRLTSKLVPENSLSTNEIFPHIYGTINVDSVIEVTKILPESENI